MPEWLISRPISNFGGEIVTADDISTSTTIITLYNHPKVQDPGGVVCLIVPMPGLLVTRKDALNA